MSGWPVGLAYPSDVFQSHRRCISLDGPIVGINTTFYFLSNTISNSQIGQKAAEAVGGFEGAIAQLLHTLGFTTKKEEDRLQEQLSGLDKEIDAYKRAAQARGVSTQSIEQVTAITKAATQAQQQQVAAIEKAKKAEEDRTRALQQYAQDIAQTKMREVQAEAETNQKRIEKMADIAAQFARSSADALRKLQQDQATMAEKFGQEQADTILAAQRDEEKSAREHVRNIKSIRDKAALDEFNAARDRDFAQLVQIRRGVEQQVSEEADRFAAERQEANIALRERLRDSAVAFQRERAARLTDYNNQLVDLRIARQRQQQDTQIAYQRELDNLRQRLQNEIALKNSALQITLMATQNWANAMRQAVGMPSTTASAGGASSGTWSQNPFLRRAAGGPLAAGQTALVNELGSERFMAGGRAMMLPRGIGVFTPLQSGTVQPAGAVGITQHIYAAPGMNEAKVAQIANEKIKATLEALIA